MIRTLSIFTLFYLLVNNAFAQGTMLNGTWKSQNGSTHYKFKNLEGETYDYEIISEPSSKTEGKAKINAGLARFYQNGEVWLETSLKLTSATTLRLGDDVLTKVGDYSYNPNGSTQSSKQPEKYERVPTPTLKSVVITRVNISKIPDTKPSGASWDNYVGNYKPDVYAIIKSPTGNELWRSTGRYDDLSNSQCPVSFTLSNIGGLKIQRAYFRNVYTLELWDMDNTNLHDSMFTSEFAISAIGFDAKKLYFNNGTFEIELDLSWVVE